MQKSYSAAEDFPAGRWINFKDGKTENRLWVRIFHEDVIKTSAAGRKIYLGKLGVKQGDERPKLETNPTLYAVKEFDQT